MRNKLGIIQLDLPDITLDGDFGDLQSTEITSLLSEEQKEIIKTLGGSKLVLCHCNKITDSSENHVRNIHCLLDKASNKLCYNYYDVELGTMTCFKIYESTDKYYIYC